MVRQPAIETDFKKSHSTVPADGRLFLACAPHAPTCIAAGHRAASSKRRNRYSSLLKHRLTTLCLQGAFIPEIWPLKKISALFRRMEALRVWKKKVCTWKERKPSTIHPHFPKDRDDSVGEFSVLCGWTRCSWRSFPTQTILWSYAQSPLENKCWSLAEQSLLRQTPYVIFVEDNGEERREKSFAKHTGNMQNRRSLPRQRLFAEKKLGLGDPALKGVQREQYGIIETPWLLFSPVS